MILFVHPWHTIINKGALWLLQYLFIFLKVKGLNVSDTSAMVAYSNLSLSSCRAEEYGDQIPNLYLLKTDYVK